MLVQLDLYVLSQKWKELVEKARAKQLQPHEYNSGYYYYKFILFSLDLYLDFLVILRESTDMLWFPNSGTFTLSNLGMFGVDRFDAILPPGQVRDWI